MFVLGIIPARGGSKGILLKNIHPLCGKPLIQWTIQEALNSTLDDLVISTDSTEIAKYYKTIWRPSELAQDDTPTLPVIQHVLEQYKQADAVMILQPTSPLRIAEDIDTAIFLLAHSNADSLVSICQGVHPVKSYDEDGTPFLHQVPYDKHRHKCYTRNGAIFLAKRELIESGRLIGDTPILYEMPKSRSIDIDDYEDLSIAEAILSRRGELN